MAICENCGQTKLTEQPCGDCGWPRNKDELTREDIKRQNKRLEHDRDEVNRPSN